MILKRLSIRGVRNLVHVEMELHPKLNFIYGENGSGKTSILEAIYLISRGRSFRTRKIQHVINREQHQLLVRAAFSDYGVQHSCGVLRDDQGLSLFKMDGRVVQSAAQLSEAAPVILIHANSQEILTGGPSGRRQFIDWGVFHVEHRFYPVWRDFDKALRQRNTFLRHGKIKSAELDAWNTIIIDTASQLDKFREAYIQTLKPVFYRVLEKIQPDLMDIQIGYHRGWDAALEYADVLVNSLDRDLVEKTTRYGPHKADMALRIGTTPFSEVASRGQIKVVLYALKVAQGQLYRDKHGHGCIYLMDDLPAELDLRHQRAIVEMLNEQDAQMVITGVDLLTMELNPKNQYAMFHVKHGGLERAERIK